MEDLKHVGRACLGGCRSSTRRKREYARFYVIVSQLPQDIFDISCCLTSSILCHSSRLCVKISMSNLTSYFVPRPSTDRSVASRPVTASTDGGLGDFSRLPLELRAKIWKIVAMPSVNRKRYKPVRWKRVPSDIAVLIT